MASSSAGRSAPLAASLAALLAAVGPAAVGLGACGPATPRGPAERVLLISCDTLRADRLGLYGYGRDTSPNLDAFAREGVVFEEAYATAPMTQPAVSSMLTGRLPLEIGVTHDNHLMIPPEIQTIAEELGQHGIPSAAVVSNFVLRRPRTSGHDSGVHQGFAFYDDRMQAEEENRVHFERLGSDTTDAAIAWLEEHGEESPYFLWVHYQDPHGPYTPPASVAERFVQPASGEPVAVSADRYGRGAIPDYQVLDGERRPSVYRDLYDAEIAYFDHELGRLLDWVEAHGLFSSSLVLFTSDHGESLGEHDFWFCHGESLYRELVRVPFVVRYPEGSFDPSNGERDGYRICRSPAGHLDVWATVLEALGVPPPESRGTSLLADALPDRRVLGQLLYPEAEQKQWWAASDGRFRVVVEGKRYRFFDIREDPGETQDLSETRTARMVALAEEFQQTLKDVRDVPLPQGTMMEQDEETLEAMRKLGYADSE